MSVCLEKKKSGAKSAVKRDLNTIVLVEWNCCRNRIIRVDYEDVGYAEWRVKVKLVRSGSRERDGVRESDARGRKTAARPFTSQDKTFKSSQDY